MTVLVFAAGVVCARLGVWQLDRLAQRRESNARIALVASLPEAVLPSNEDMRAQEYRAVSARGTYDLKNQFALRNQARLGEYGFHLLTPMQLLGNDAADAESAVLVDRGWIPAAGNNDPSDWRKYDVAGIVQVEGVIRVPQAALVSGAANSGSAPGDQPVDRFALVVDPVAISRQVGYSMPAYYIQATGGQDRNALPVAEAPDLDAGNGPHLGYAIQWFGFAVTLLVGYVLYVARHEAGRT